MKLKHIAGLVLCAAALVALVICIFTDWNDRLCLPLALGLSAAGNLCNVLPDRLGRAGKESGK